MGGAVRQPAPAHGSVVVRPAGAADSARLRTLGGSRRPGPLPERLRPGPRAASRTRCRRYPHRPSGSRRLAGLHRRRRRAARRVVVATGYSHTPRRPDWPGLDTFPGDLRHSADYREPSAYARRHVLVVGAGNSATEIALDLLGVGATVTLSVRTHPTSSAATRSACPANCSASPVKAPTVAKDPPAAGETNQHPRPVRVRTTAPAQPHHPVPGNRPRPHPGHRHRRRRSVRPGPRRGGAVSVEGPHVRLVDGGMSSQTQSSPPFTTGLQRWSATSASSTSGECLESTAPTTSRPHRDCTSSASRPNCPACYARSSWRHAPSVRHSPQRTDPPTAACCDA